MATIKSICLALLLVLGISACSQSDPPATPLTEASAAPATGNCPPGPGAVISGELHGAIAGLVRGEADDTVCEGMSRPQNKGARLRFQTRLPDAEDALVVILGIDQITAGDTGSGIRTTVTFIDEGRQQFYSSGDQNSCFSDIASHAPVGSQNSSLIEGLVWCTAAIPALNGADSVRITELNFRGSIRWRESS